MEALLADGLVAPAEALPLAARFADTSEHVLMETAVNMSGTIARFVPPESKEQYARFLRRSFGSKAVAVGWRPQPAEHEEVALLRPRLPGLLASSGKHIDVIAQAKRLTAEWLRDRSVVDSGVVPALLAAAAADSD